MATIILHVYPVKINTECPNGTYGYRCSKECGKCHNSEICDKATGNCDNGCERWYIHPGKCDLYIGRSCIKIKMTPVYTAFS